jgi:NADPH:quinone reductase-like Zn-dependent oxidoreductase
MKQIQFHRSGPPPEAVQCVKIADPTIPAPDDVLVRVEVFPINPADLLTMRGIYPRSDPSSSTLGIEALGVVEAVGASVVEIAPGDRVILLSVDNWSQKKLVEADQVVRVSPDADRFRLATLKVNPATAALLLTLFVDLRPGGLALARRLCEERQWPVVTEAVIRGVCRTQMWMLCGHQSRSDETLRFRKPMTRDAWSGRK